MGFDQCAEVVFEIILGHLIRAPVKMGRDAANCTTIGFNGSLPLALSNQCVNMLFIELVETILLSLVHGKSSVVRPSIGSARHYLLVNESRFICRVAASSNMGIKSWLRHSNAPPAAPCRLCWCMQYRQLLATIACASMTLIMDR